MNESVSLLTAVVAGLVSFMEGAMLYGVFHGDLHGGNLTVQPDGRILTAGNRTNAGGDAGRDDPAEGHQEDAPAAGPLAGGLEPLDQQRLCDRSPGGSVG